MVVFFDLDDTLVDSDGAHTKAISQIIKEYSLTGANDSEAIMQRWLDIKNKYLTLYFNNKISLEQQRISRVTEFWAGLGLNIDEEQADIIYKQYHHIFLDSCKPFEDTIPLLKKLSSQVGKFKLGIITNGTSPDQIYKLEKNNLMSFFDFIVISEKVGVSKPSKEIFQIAALMADVHESDCVYIGNDYDLDYIGSLNAGMKAVWLDRNNSANIRQMNSPETISTLLHISLL